MDGHSGNPPTRSLDGENARHRANRRRWSVSKAFAGSRPARRNLYIRGRQFRPRPAESSHAPGDATGVEYRGSIVLEVEGPRLEATFVDSHGNERDKFSLVKGPRPVTHVGERRGEESPERAARNSRTAQALLRSINAPPPVRLLTNALPADQELLLNLCPGRRPGAKTAADWALRNHWQRVPSRHSSWACSPTSPERTLRRPKRNLRLVTVHCAGMLAQRYEPLACAQGTSADWWYFAELVPPAPCTSPRARSLPAPSRAGTQWSSEAWDPR